MSSAGLRLLWSKVNTWRSCGVSARWSRNHLGAPRIFINTDNGVGNWYLLDKSLLDCICRALDHGDDLLSAARGALATADLFSIPA